MNAPYAARIRRLGQWCVHALVGCYQSIISPVLPVSCRFYPTCSNYAVAAVAYYGIGKGLWKTMQRLLRCHPWSPGGYDPVLPNEEN